MAAYSVKSPGDPVQQGARRGRASPSGVMVATAPPELLNPFDGRPSVHQRVVAAETARWMIDVGLAPGAAAERMAGEVATLAALAYPFCDAEGLRIAADWCAWLFAWDDRRDVKALGARPDHVSYQAARFLDVLAGAAPGGASLERALADLRARMLDRRPGRWFHRFRGAVRDYFSACVWEADHRLRGAVPDPEAYLARRPQSGAVLSAFELFAATDGADLPDHVRVAPAFVALERAASNVICWSNDVRSLDRELETGDGHNLVVVLMTYEEVSRREAVRLVAALHDDEVCRYLGGERLLPSFGAATDELVALRCRLMRAWMFANEAFAAQSPRTRVGAAER